MLTQAEIKTEVLPAPDAPETGSGILYVFCEPLSGSVIRLAHIEEVYIGTDPSVCGLIVSGEGISRRHCCLSYNAQSGTYLLMDLSTNGTYLLSPTDRNLAGAPAARRLPQNHLMELEPGTAFYLSEPENRFLVG